MSASGQKRTCAVQNGMSALPPIADIRQPWFWTITAFEIPPSVHNRGYSAVAWSNGGMAAFKLAGGRQKTVRP